MQWRCLDQRIDSGVVFLASVGKADGRSKVDGPGKCLDNTNLQTFRIGRKTYLSAVRVREGMQ